MGESNRKELFEIGLVMAGAISAGAYNAGVIDYLLQALVQFRPAGILCKALRVGKIF